jgi:ferredoxin
VSDDWFVTVDRTACIGNQMCIALAPDIFEMVDGASHPRTPRITPSEQLTDAYDSCPASAIELRRADDHDLNRHLTNGDNG